MSKLFSSVGLSVRGDFLIALALLTNGIVWFYIAYVIIDNLVIQFHLTGMEETLAYLMYFSFASFSAFIGSLLSKKFNKISLLRIWVILGIAGSIFPILITESFLPQILAISIFLGFSFGLGMPSCLSYFVNVTAFGNRGFFSGLIFMITNLMAPFFVATLSANLTLTCLISALWKSVGLLVLLAKPKEENHLALDFHGKSFRSILSEKAFLLYFVAWLMFCLVERMETPLISNILKSFSSVVFSIGPFIGAISSLVAGILSDRIGRKKIMLSCFPMYGVAYAVIGLAPYSVFSWYLYLIIYSVTSGALWMIFILVIWGEIANSKHSEKHFALGEFPYFLAYIAQLFVTPHVLEIEKTSAFSLAAFFLFLAVIPLMYAPETLPEKKIKERELKEYIEKAKKIKEKYG